MIGTRRLTGEMRLRSTNAWENVAFVDATLGLGHESSFTPEKLFYLENSDVTTTLPRNVVKLVKLLLVLRS